MALRKIITNDDETLSKRSREVTSFDTRLHTLLDDMLETLRDKNGVGLAAPQVGVLRRAVVIEILEDEIIELINPEIISIEGTQNGSEGCLSFPGKYGMVERPMNVKAKALDRHGKEITITGDGLLARAICHEVDHLNGVLFTSLVSEFIDPNAEDDMESEE